MRRLVPHAAQSLSQLNLVLAVSAIANDVLPSEHHTPHQLLKRSVFHCISSEEISKRDAPCHLQEFI
jgi:hypothetical protein